MISAHELNPHDSPVTPEQAANLAILLERINIIRTHWAKPMTVTSAFRTLEDHRRIYMNIAKRSRMNTIHIPMGSAHLKGAAADIADQDGSLYKYCEQNQNILEEAKLWCEKDTKGWVHFQIYAPASGHRFFYP